MFENSKFSSTYSLKAQEVRDAAQNNEDNSSAFSLELTTNVAKKQPIILFCGASVPLQELDLFCRISGYAQRVEYRQGNEVRFFDSRVPPADEIPCFVALSRKDGTALICSTRKSSPRGSFDFYDEIDELYIRAVACGVNLYFAAHVDKNSTPAVTFACTNAKAQVELLDSYVVCIAQQRWKEVSQYAV